MLLLEELELLALSRYLSELSLASQSSTIKMRRANSVLLETKLGKTWIMFTF